MTPSEYEAWYHSPRGSWVSTCEFQLMTRLVQPTPGQRLLDVGCGTGHFSRRFARTGLHVTGLDQDPEAIKFAQSQDRQVTYLTGTMQNLPFANGGFEHVTAITSLCFVEDPVPALREMWRVCSNSLLLGLLNKHSLLYFEKHDRGAYRGAHWDTISAVGAVVAALEPRPTLTLFRSAIFTPGNSSLQRRLEPFFPPRLPWGAFLAVYIKK